EFESPRTGVLPWVARAGAIVEVDGDGILDLVALSRDTAELAIVPGDGVGWVRFVTRVPLPYRADVLAAADLDGDGRRDLVLGAIGRPEVIAIRRGTLPAVQSPMQLLGGSLSIADVDGDRRPDLLALDAAGTALVVLRGDGLGGFTEAGTVAAAA